MTKRFATANLHKEDLGRLRITAVAHVPVKWIYPMARPEGAHRAALVENQILALGQTQGL
ncbi:hypothetical protein BLX90_22565 [Rhizobium sp. Y9]|nr:hypothetical protein BLX90_22565 [Rhizobium sp. Y9]